LTQINTDPGFKGNKYAQTRDLPLKDVAQLIKKEILANHPEIKVSVSTESYSGGQSINIKVTKVPFAPYRKVELYPGQNSSYYTLRYTDQGKALIEEIKTISNQYNRDNSDLQTDYFDVHFYCTPEYAFEIRMQAEKQPMELE
jgi:hypothetical protein